MGSRGDATYFTAFQSMSAATSQQVNGSRALLSKSMPGPVHEQANWHTSPTTHCTRCEQTSRQGHDPPAMAMRWRESVGITVTPDPKCGMSCYSGRQVAPIRTSARIRNDLIQINHLQVFSAEVSDSGC